ncbi:hypothetical protein HN446_00855 [bacterium]|jgi:hypothetical protein|nr:hypothetical protein [bacterium]
MDKTVFVVIFLFITPIFFKSYSFEYSTTPLLGSSSMWGDRQINDYAKTAGKRLLKNLDLQTPLLALDSVIEEFTEVITHYYSGERFNKSVAIKMVDFLVGDVVYDNRAFIEKQWGAYEW